MTAQAASGLESYPTPDPLFVLPNVDVPVACDTETSKLHSDDGGRVSVVSVAWIPETILRDDELLDVAIKTGEGVVSYAFPFDQGTRDKHPLPTWAIKRYKPGQGDLFAQADPNLDESSWRFLLDWLRARGRKLVFHHAKFDLTMLRVGTRHWAGTDLETRVWWDTQLVNKELWPLESTSLKPTAARLWGFNETAEQMALKPWLGPKVDPRYDLIPLEILAPYAAKDAELTIRLFHEQKRRVALGEARIDWIERERRVMRVLYRMELRGMPYNAARSLEACQQLELVKAQVADRLPFKPSLNAAKRYYFGSSDQGGLGRLPYEVTAQGVPVLNEDTVRRLERDGAPFADVWAQWRKIDDAQSRWYRAYAEMTGADGRLRTNFRQTHVKSGRFSVERFQAQALPHAHKLKLIPQNVPHPRDLFEFEPNEGWEVDLAQAELRVAAKYAQCDRMLQMIADGVDLHGYTAAELFQTDSSDPNWYKLRQVGKRGNFSCIFDVGPRTFQYQVRIHAGVEITEMQAERFVRGWGQLYPEFRRANRDYQFQTGRIGYVPLVNGKRRWYQPYEDHHSSYNQFVQASLAEGMKEWMLDTERRYAALEALVLMVHDSLMLECPAGEGERIAKDVADRGAEIFTDMFGTPMTCEYSRWGEH
jgi:DNA polymerase I-like protein with 3'-5' exonuclease and polymerase domains